jgi:hypothetical protein
MGKRKLHPSIAIYRRNEIRIQEKQEEAGGGVRRPATYQMGHLSSLPILSRLPTSAIPTPSAASHRISPLHESLELSRRGYGEFRFRGWEERGAFQGGGIYFWRGFFPPRLFFRDFVAPSFSEAGGQGTHPHLGASLPGWSLPVGWAGLGWGRRCVRGGSRVAFKPLNYDKTVLVIYDGIKVVMVYNLIYGSIFLNP